MACLDNLLHLDRCGRLIFPLPDCHLLDPTRRKANRTAVALARLIGCSAFSYLASSMLIDRPHLLALTSQTDNIRSDTANSGSAAGSSPTCRSGQTSVPPTASRPSAARWRNNIHDGAGYLIRVMTESSRSL